MKIEFNQDDAKELKEQIIGAVENALAALEYDSIINIKYYKAIFG